MTLAWLTPNVDQLQESHQQRTLCVAGSLWYLVSGALELLAEEWNWEEFGTANADEVATYFQDVRDKYMSSQSGNIGQISAFLVVPDGWYEMNNQLLVIADFPELAAIVPDSWFFRGGILLPDMTARGLSGHGLYDGNNIDVGELGGLNSSQIDLSEMPGHSHGVVRPNGPQAILLGELAPVTISNAPINGFTDQVGGGAYRPMKSSYMAIRWCIYAGC